jgi:hypothetical protein
LFIELAVAQVGHFEEFLGLFIDARLYKGAHDSQEENTQVIQSDVVFSFTT